MSEEKPTFKVTDRRLFNPDGTPREIEREEEPATPPATEESAAAAVSTAGAEQHAEPAAVEAGRAPSTAPAAGGGGSAAAERGGAVAEPGEEDDPQEFLMVVEFIASFAADALGMVEHPGAGRGDINLPLAKQCIDMLVTLQRKTRGNLSPDEQHVFDLILSQLRMQYVRVADAARGQQPQPPRGFSGGDITGGR